MTEYRLTLVFENQDNFLGTAHAAAMDITIRADDSDHAYLLARKVCDIFGADYFNLDQIA